MKPNVRSTFKAAGGFYIEISAKMIKDNGTPYITSIHSLVVYVDKSFIPFIVNPGQRKRVVISNGYPVNR